MKAATLYASTASGSEFVIGTVQKWAGGADAGKFWFKPNMPSRRPSRKPHAQPRDCIPKWASKMATHIEYADRESEQ